MFYKAEIYSSRICRNSFFITKRQDFEFREESSVMEKVKILWLILVTVLHPIREKIHERETGGEGGERGG